MKLKIELEPKSERFWEDPEFQETDSPVFNKKDKRKAVSLFRILTKRKIENSDLETSRSASATSRKGKGHNRAITSLAGAGVGGTEGDGTGLIFKTAKVVGGMIGEGERAYNKFFS